MKKTLLILISIFLLLQAFVFTGCDVSNTELPENSSEILSDENEELTPPSSGDDFSNGDFSDGDFSEPPVEAEVAIHFANPDKYFAFLNGEADISSVYSVITSKYIGVTPEELVEYVRNAPIYAIESSAENYSSGWGLAFHIKKESYYSNYLFYYNYHGGGFDNISFTFDAEMGPLTAEARQIYEKQGIEGLKCPREYDKKVTITIDGNDYEALLATCHHFGQHPYVEFVYNDYLIVIWLYCSDTGEEEIINIVETMQFVPVKTNE